MRLRGTTLVGEATNIPVQGLAYGKALQVEQVPQPTATGIAGVVQVKVADE